MGEWEFIEIKDTIKCEAELKILKKNVEKTYTMEDLVTMPLSKIIKDNPDNYLNIIRQWILYWINKFRKDKKLEPLELDNTLNKFSQESATWLADNNMTWHDQLGITQRFMRNFTIKITYGGETKIAHPLGENNAYGTIDSSINDIIHYRSLSTWPDWHLKTMTYDKNNTPYKWGKIEWKQILWTWYSRNKKIWYDVMVIEIAIF